MSENFRSMEEIIEAIDRIKPMVNKKNISQICKSASKILESADASEKQGDLKMALIYLGRYMNLLTQLQHRKEYQQQKNYIRNMLGGNAEQQKRMERMEKLKIIVQQSFKAIQESVENNATTINNQPTTILDNPEDPKQPEIRETITCEQLNEMIENDGNKILIIDCRSNNDFENSKIIFQFICNVPEELCCIGMTSSKIQKKLPDGSKVYWEMRKDRSTIVFIDWRSRCFSRNSPVWQLRSTLKEYDQDMEKLPEMVLLVGGFEEFLYRFPWRCSNPHAKMPTNLDKSSSALTFDGIEYPSLDDITMKDSSFSSTKVPQIDRSTKGLAIKSYEEKNLSRGELLEEKERIINRSLQYDKELLKLEQDLDTLNDNKENESDLSTKQEKLYEIWELDTKKKDLAFQNEEINMELEKVEKTKISTPISKHEELENRLKQKEMEDKKMRDDIDRKRREREENLKVARQNKPRFDDHKLPVKAPRNNELILSPSTLNQNVITPHFDRTSKPSFQNSQHFYDNQDFAPCYQKVERGLTGLKNLGNTCYMNSIIQCLSHTLSLKQFLFEKTYEKQINRSNNTKGHIVRTLAAVIKMLWNGECKYISSKHLKAVIGEQENLFCGMDQQDAHEFLVMLIDWLQSDLQTIPMSEYIEKSPPAEKAWLAYTKAKESFILRLFYGQIKSTVKCKVCGEESATFDTFSNLSLELPMINIERCHISSCFNMYFNGEFISGWNCPKCKVPRDAIKKLDISKLPPVLIIHLKRFYADSYSFRKKSIYVDFPYTDLDMLQYVSPKEKATVARTNHVYYLYAVSNHYGTMQSGHYTAFCRNARQNKWYKFDDHNVSHIDKSDVKSSAAYILFYTYLPETNFMN